MSRLPMPLEGTKPLEFDGQRVRSILFETETDKTIDVVLSDGTKKTVDIDEIIKWAQED